MKTLFAFLGVLCSSLVSAASGYYVVVENANGAYVSPLYQGYKSGCFVLPSMAINSALSNLASVQAIGVNGYWRAVKTNLTTRIYSGLFYPCDNAQYGTVPAFVTGASDPVLTSESLSGGSGSTPDLTALQSTVTGLQTTIATQQSTLTTLTNAQAEEFDLTKALAAFSFFFGSIVLLWSVAKGGGMVLAAIRAGRRW